MTTIHTIDLQDYWEQLVRAKRALEEALSTLPEILLPYALPGNAMPHPTAVLPPEILAGEDRSELINWFYKWQYADLGFPLSLQASYKELSELRDSIGVEQFNTGVILCCGDLRTAIQADTARETNLKITDWPLNAVNWVKAEAEAVKKGLYKSVKHNNATWYYKIGG